MELHRPAKRDQSEFSVVEVSLVSLVVAVLAVSGFVVYQRHKSISAKNSVATSTSQTTTQPQSSTTTQPATTTMQYLTIKEWGVKLPLSSAISDAFYTVEGSNIGADNLPNTAWLGLTSLNGTGCNISTTGPS